MKIVLPGGSGFLGQLLAEALAGDGHECVILSRRPRTAVKGVRHVAWDGRTLGPWAVELDGADVVVNLAGRTVDCRYHEKNLAEMMDSRVASTRVVGEAIAQAKNPPRVWLQAATATIYGHRYDAPNDEVTGIIGDPPGAPALWGRSVDIGKAWEATLFAAPTPRTRKVALRIAMVMSPAKGTVFRILMRHCRMGFGRFGDGRQYVSWIHGHDFVEAVKFLIAREDLSGAINLCAPHPLPNREFLAALSRLLGRRLAIPVPGWMLEIGTFFLRTETELILKSRRVVPRRLLEAGFVFHHPHWPEAAKDLMARM
jgi:uncharacterized protein (TIGR01777 family)